MPVTDGPTLEALAGAISAPALDCLFTKSLPASLPHPTHWVGAAISVAGGYGAGAPFVVWKGSS